MVQKVTEKVAQDLGCVETALVDAQLYKMLLYEEGAMFKPHKEYVRPYCNLLDFLTHS